MIDASAADLSFLPLKFSRNKLAHTIEAADTTLASRVGLKYMLSLYVPEYPFSALFEELHTSEGRELPVTTDGGVQVFSGAEFRYNSGRNGKIDGLLSYTKPRWKQNSLSLSLSQTTAFYLREAIQGGTPPVALAADLPKAYAIKAGLSNEDFHAYGDSFFKTWQGTKRQFLTWQPDQKTVSPSQEEYLSFLLNFTPAPTELRLRVHYIYPNGSASNAFTVMTLANPLLYSVVTCPVGPAVAGVPSNAVKYEVWLSDQNNRRFTETRTYHVDRSLQVADRSILFVNSLGGWDTFRLTGEGGRSLRVAQTTAEIERKATSDPDFSELKIISIEGEHEVQANTGYFRKDQAAYLKYLDELLLSDEMYLVTEKGHRPVQLTTTTHTDEQDNTDLIARAFTFRILSTVENFSDLPASQPTPARATKWRGLNLQQVLDGFGKRTGKLAFSRLEKVYADDNTLVKPYSVKNNIQGDPDYIAPITDTTIVVGSTPFPSAAISRAGSFMRSNCGPNYLGSTATVTIPAGYYGGERAGEADVLAEARYDALNTQAFADANGSCVVNNVPVQFAILHKIPMDANLKVIGSADYGPVVDVRVNGVEIISNTVGANPPQTGNSGTLTVMPGTYDIIVQVEYAQQAPIRKCKVVIPSKNREVKVEQSGYYAFDGVVVNSSDQPLTFEVVNL